MTPIRDPHRKRGYHCSGVLTCKDTGYVLACLATRKKVLATVQENLLRHNHSMIQFVSAQNLPFATNQWVNCGVQSLFSRNHQTIALKSLKANCSWNILVEKVAKGQALQSIGQSDVLQGWETIAKSQALQTVGPSDILQALVKTIAKSQALQSVGQSDILQALVEKVAKSQALQTAGPSDVLQALVENIAKSQALQTAGQSDVLKALVETKAKSQALQSVRQSDVLEALVEVIAEIQALQTAA